MKQQPILIVCLLVALFVVQSGGSQPIPLRAASPQLPNEVSGTERFANLAVGVPGESIAGQAGAGHVNVLYGTTTGLSAAGNQGWSQESTGVVGGPEVGDRFGTALTAGDFDGDGYTDLAVGVPGESIAGQAGAGHVNVLYGTATGLAATGNQGWSQESTGVVGGPEAGDRFGWALAAFPINIARCVYLPLVIRES
jgi:hypothetical protein